MVWLIGRIRADTEEDFDHVFRLQDRFTLTPLDRWPAGEANKAFTVEETDFYEKSYNPSARVENMSAGEFFAELSELMGKNPPAPADKPMLEILNSFDIMPGKKFDLNEMFFFRRLLLEKSVELARQKLLEIAESDLSTENNWAVRRDGIGVYGTDYQVRAFVSMIGLGALEPKEAAYPNSMKDGEGRPLTGKHAYRIHFEPGMTPPVHAFWSLTVYDRDGFLINNPIHRYTIGDRNDLNFNADGSLDILIQHRRPARGITNWLPAPADEFAVTMRLYMPKSEFLDGTWKLPPIERVE